MTVCRRPVDNALSPAWRGAVVHLITGQEWNDVLPEEIAEETIDELTHGKGYLRQLAPDSQWSVHQRVALALFDLLFSVPIILTMHQANPYEPDWQWSFWGPTYPHLQAIKQYDPDNVLWCRNYVGSERLVRHQNGSLCTAF